MDSRRRAANGLVLATALIGVAAFALGSAFVTRTAWLVLTLCVALPLSLDVARSLRRRTTGVDAIALLAMLSALAVSEYFAAAVVALMVWGGAALERYAGNRARRDLSGLLARSPREAHRYSGEEFSSIPADDVRCGDRLLVKPGETVPVDGIVASDAGVLDESTLTGESIPVERARGDQVRSGAVNAGPPFDLIATAMASESTYASIVRLAREAEARKAPFVRMADRYAAFFLPATILAAGTAWAFSGDPRRAVAVLVVATPCPMILAAPIAFISGISRAARRGIIVKGGAPLEALARARVLLMDKTGTITTGVPRVAEVVPFGAWEPDELLRLAASLDQVSSHTFAPAIVREARSRGLVLSMPDAVVERAGQGIEGRVEARRVAVGQGKWVAGTTVVPPAVRRIRRRIAIDGSASAFIAIDGCLAGALVLHDPIRPDALRTIRALRSSGIERVVLVTGDHAFVAEAVGAGIGADAVLAERSAAEKVDAVRAEGARAPTIMIGDGVNDAPALAAAGVGVALGARGSTASSEAADVVLLVDRLDRLAEAIRIARRSTRIARQSVAAGMGLSVAAMGLAGAGFLPPVAGALLQEAIDVAVIVNALRALRGSPRKTPAESPLARRFEADHRLLFPRLARLRRLADQLDELPPEAALRELNEVRKLLEEQIAPHEASEDALLYPAVARRIGGEDPTASMSRAHLEIAHLIRTYGRLLGEVQPAGPDAEDVRDLRRVLYGLHAILSLHFAQEDENFLSLFEEPAKVD